jgi:hypothetical protein
VHVLLDTGCDKGDLSTVQDEVTPSKIVCHFVSFVNFSEVLICFDQNILS